MNLKYVLVALGAAAMAFSAPALAQKKYDPGASDKEIVIGGIHPYSGPASAYGVIGKAIGAYFQKLNDDGGINGRKIKWIDMDDGYNPAKTVEVARKLVEQDEVLFILNPLGTPGNTAIHKYMNQKKVPQLFVSSGDSKFGDPKNFPWTMGFQLNYRDESKIYGKHILETNPNAKIAVLMQNDDFGKDNLKGFEEGLGDKAKSMIVKLVSYEVTDPTVDSQIVTLKTTGADTFYSITTPKFAAQSIKKVAEIGWKPVFYLSNVSASVGSVLKPAGLENSVGLLTAAYLKDPTDPQWQKGKEWDDYAAWFKKYLPGGNIDDGFYTAGYTFAQAAEKVLRQAGDNLTRANIMKQAASLDTPLPMLLPGITVKTSATDFYPVEQGRLSKFDGKHWELFGKIYGD